ncbi:hypothetical protein K1T71_011645 [Dendrolimus kikuchii]|uniref:Uncharacterized protein n=1 Tax=Dendrolimus kikuchii TaxID=765133 RepID=A0ACC1CM35_9NEOP|nr:hypothetical protein K1T71_011645 [Dendrolimus kikuchii]
MPRKKHCYWTRRLEFELVEFIRKRHFIWKYTGNTNHHIQQKYKAYAEFAAKLGPGFTARSVRDRWVNIRNTFNYNLRKLEKSKENAKSTADIYTPSWPLWRPLQFLREAARKEDGNLETFEELSMKINSESELKEELQPDEQIDIGIRQRGQQRYKPRQKSPIGNRKEKRSCKKVLDDLIEAMAPVMKLQDPNIKKQYLYFGQYVTEVLNSMRTVDAEIACQDIQNLFNNRSDNLEPLS